MRSTWQKPDNYPSPSECTMKYIDVDDRSGCLSPVVYKINLWAYKKFNITTTAYAAYLLMC